MALYIPHSIFHLARLLCVRPETFGPYYVYVQSQFLHTITQPDVQSVFGTVECDTHKLPLPRSPCTLQRTAPPSFYHGAKAPVGQGFIDSFQDAWSHSVTHTTLGTTPLEEWSARQRDLYQTIHNSQETDIRTRNPSKRAAVDPRLRRRDHWHRRSELTIHPKYTKLIEILCLLTKRLNIRFFWMIRFRVCTKNVHNFMLFTLHKFIYSRKATPTGPRGFWSVKAPDY